MKFLIITCLLLLGAAWYKCDAQVREASARGANGRIRSPITIFVKSKTLLEMGPWSFCADVAVNRNSLPHASLGNNLLKQYHGSAPVYGSLELSPLCAIEGGAYFGLVANRAEALGERPLPAYVDPNYELGFDSGLVSGLSFDLEKFGRVRLRYNFGLSNLLNTDNQTIRTRRLDLGLDFKF